MSSTYESNARIGSGLAAVTSHKTTLLSTDKYEYVTLSEGAGEMSMKSIIGLSISNG